MSPVRMFDQVLDALAAGRRLALATVVETAGSTPRHAGARMAVADDGQAWGTIGGGRIEQEIVAAAREVAAGGAPRRVRHHLVRDLAMCCGGRMDVAIADAAASAPALAAAAAARPGAPVLLDTPLDGGPLRAAPATPADARALRQPVVAASAGGAAGGAASASDAAGGAVLREAFGVPQRVVVLGAGHVGRAIGELAHRLEFEVALCDDDDTGALAAPAPWAARVVAAFDLPAIARELGGLGDGDLVLIVTRDHAVDQRLVEQYLAGAPGVDADALTFAGMIGSRGKVARFAKRMAARGLLDGAGQARWDRLAAPIGLDLGAETPDEIAVAVVAQLVAVRRRGAAEAGRWAATPPGGGDAP